MPGGDPEGWVQVPEEVSQDAYGGATAVAARAGFAEWDAWGAGVSPRLVSLIQSLVRGGRLGPTTLDSLRRMLLEANDDTYQALGGDITFYWVFAPVEWERLVSVVEEETSALSQRDKAGRKLEIAAERNAKVWAKAHGIADK